MIFSLVAAILTGSGFFIGWFIGRYQSRSEVIKRKMESGECDEVLDALKMKYGRK